MKRKRIASVLMACGAGVLGLVPILVFVATTTIDIIGGVSWPTVWNVYFNAHGGVYFILTLVGLAAVATAVVLRVKGKKA